MDEVKYYCLMFCCLLYFELNIQFDRLNHWYDARRRFHIFGNNVVIENNVLIGEVIDDVGGLMVQMFYWFFIILYLQVIFKSIQVLGPQCVKQYYHLHTPKTQFLIDIFYLLYAPHLMFTRMPSPQHRNIKTFSDIEKVLKLQTRGT